MECFVYRSTKKSETYIYMQDENKLEELPDSLDRLLGKLEFVMKVDLSARSQLANAEIEDVKEQVIKQGFYIQLPRELHVPV